MSEYGYHQARMMTSDDIIINADNNGFVPVDKEMDKSKIRKGDDLVGKTYEFDPLKLAYLQKYAEEVGDSHNIRLIDFSNNPKYVHNDIYFKDGSHLNARGADEFTRDLIMELKRRDLLN